MFLIYLYNECYFFTFFNCHGFNNDEPVTAGLLEAVDILCIQEHWLSNHNLNLLTTLHNDCTAYDESSMLRVTQEMKMHCRSFGDVAF